MSQVDTRPGEGRAGLLRQTHLSHMYTQPLLTLYLRHIYDAREGQWRQSLKRRCERAGPWCGVAGRGWAGCWKGWGLERRRGEARSV